MKFIKCLHQRSGLKETIKENDFVNWVRENLGNKTLSGKDNDISKNTYNYLKTLQPEDYKQYITETWNLPILKQNKPKTQKEFRTIISDYIKDNSQYANQYDTELLKSFCGDTIKFKISNNLPKTDYEFDKDTVYLLRIDNDKGYTHYQAII